METVQGTLPSTSGLKVEPRMVSFLQVMSLWEARLNNLPFPVLITDPRGGKAAKSAVRSDRCYSFVGTVFPHRSHQRAVQSEE